MPAPLGQSGFTVLEVVLALALGIFIVGGVSIGYLYGKHAMIASNMRTEVLSFKGLVEDARAAKAAAGTATTGPLLTFNQVCGYLKRIPSLQKNPYTGTDRVSFVSEGGPCVTQTGSDSVYYIHNYADDPAITNPISSSRDIDAGITGSSIFYLCCDSSNPGSVDCKTQPFTINLSNGTTSIVYGYAIFETDADGNVVAVAGGDKTL